MTTATELITTLVSPAVSPVTVESACGGLELVDRWSDEWRDLCAHSVDDQPFFRPEWIRAYLRAFVPGGKIILITAKCSGRLCLILPLVQETATFAGVPVRRLRSPANSTCGRFDAVRRAGPEGEAAALATWRHLRGMNNWDLLQFRDALENSTVEEIAACARVDGFITLTEPDKPNPFIPLSNAPGWLERMPPNSKLRSQMRQARKRLAEQGKVTFRRVNTADRQELESFYRLEAGGWKGRIRSCALYDGSRPFYDEVAESAAQFGYLSLYTLKLNERLLAAHFSFTHGGRCYSPKVAYDEEFKPFAPGHLIIGEILQDCVTRGIAAYDITGQDQSWKMKWTSEVRRINHHFIFKGPMGRLAHAISRLKPALNLFTRRKPETQSDELERPNSDGNGR